MGDVLNYANPPLEAIAMQVLIETFAGEIVIEVLEEKAPRTAAYFLGFVDRGNYNGATFYRSTRLSVPNGPRLIQGGLLGGALTGTASNSSDGTSVALLEEIETTAQTGLAHEYATVSLARDLLSTGFVLSDFFICLGDFPQLDFGGRQEPDHRGFPAFGQVVAGIDLVRTISEGETTGATPIDMLAGQILTRPVTISKACRK
jgi:peptidyl-prolyl cis-trans isomerase A (cyclophilin A)